MSSTTAVASPTDDGRGPVTGPVWLLVLGIVIPLLTGAGLFVPSIGVHVACWLIATFGSVGMLAAFTVIDLDRRRSRRYVDQKQLLAALRVAVLVVGLVMAGWFAYLIADYVARLDWWGE